MRESYLEGLAAQTGLVYHHLESANSLTAALQADTFTERIRVAADVRWIPALLTLLILVFLYGMVPRMARWL